jgi:hypothetical protein
MHHPMVGIVALTLSYRSVWRMHVRVDAGRLSARESSHIDPSAQAKDQQTCLAFLFGRKLAI